MGNLVTQAQSAYETWKTKNYPSDIAGWDTLTDSQVSELFRNDRKYQQAIADAQSIEDAFIEARGEAFTTFEQNYQTQRSALATLWQEKENADYDVDYTGA